MVRDQADREVLGLALSAYEKDTIAARMFLFSVDREKGGSFDVVFLFVRMMMMDV